MLENHMAKPIKETYKTCQDCKGSGEIYTEDCKGDPTFIVCRNCGGDGEYMVRE